MSDIPGLEDAPPFDINKAVGRNLLLRQVLKNHLKRRFDVPFLQVRQCVAPTVEESWVFALYRNIDLVEGFAVPTGEEVDAIARRLQNPGDVMPRAQWCWDYTDYGFG